MPATDLGGEWVPISRGTKPTVLWIPPTLLKGEKRVTYYNSPFKERLVQVNAYLADHADIRETARNTDRGGWIDRALRRLGLGPNPWCAAIQWEACIRAGWPFATQPKNPASVRSWVAWAKKEGRFLPLTPKTIQPLRGMLVGWSKGSNGHIGVAIANATDGRVFTIEGNTDAQGTPEGDGMYRRVRRPDEFFAGHWYAINLEETQ